MREPAGSASAAGRDRIQFCASCDVSPAGRRSGPGPSAATSSTPASFTHLQSQQINPSNQTKAQTDPSESISTLLLQGYSLLGDNCPNMSCRGIPLVGYPKKKDGSKDGRRMCVSCGGRWVDGNDLGGMTLMSGTGKEAEKGGAEAGGAASGSMLGGGESPRSKARREMYGLPGPSDNDKGKAPATAQATTTAPVSIPDLNDDEDDFGLDREEDDEPELQQRVSPTSSHLLCELGYILIFRSPLLLLPLVRPPPPTLIHCYRRRSLRLRRHSLKRSTGSLLPSISILRATGRRGGTLSMSSCIRRLSRMSWRYWRPSRSTGHRYQEW
jgi:hypothetical protein